jgi:hypothetical protein
VVVGRRMLHPALAPVLIFGLAVAPPARGADLSLARPHCVLRLNPRRYIERPRQRTPGRHTRVVASLDILRVGLLGAANTVLILPRVAVASPVGTSTHLRPGWPALAHASNTCRSRWSSVGTALVTIVGTNVALASQARAAALHVSRRWDCRGHQRRHRHRRRAVSRRSGWARSPDPDVFRRARAICVGPTYAAFGFGLALYFASQGADAFGGRCWPVSAVHFTVGGGAAGGPVFAPERLAWVFVRGGELRAVRAESGPPPLAPRGPLAGSAAAVVTRYAGLCAPGPCPPRLAALHCAALRGSAASAAGTASVTSMTCTAAT